MLHEHHPLVGRKTAIVTAAPLSIRVAADVARFSLRIDPSAIDGASKAFGLKLPATIGGLAVEGEKRAVCLGPDEWYLAAPLVEQEAVEAAFAELYAKTEVWRTFADHVWGLLEAASREIALDI